MALWIIQTSRGNAVELFSNYKEVCVLMLLTDFISLGSGPHKSLYPRCHLV